MAAAPPATKSPEGTERTIDDGQGNVWLIRRVLPKTRRSAASRSISAMLPARRSPPSASASTTRSPRRRRRWSGSTSRARQRGQDALGNRALARSADRIGVARIAHAARLHLGAATILSNAPALADDARLHALTLLVRDEAERLTNDIQNLLDATTISSHRVRPKLQWIEPVDIVNAALKHRSRRLAGHPVTLDLDSNLPIVRADPMQVEQTLMQILDNAAKYSADGAPIRVAARPNGQSVVLSVHDCGAGLTEEEKRRSAAASSAARGLPPARRDRASACGSPTLSSPRMVARSMSRATAPTGAPRSIHLPLPGEATPSQISIDE